MSLMESKPGRFTRDEYYRMGDAGLFQDRRVQLIEGDVIEMAPQKNDHAVAIALVDQRMRAAFPNCTVRGQLPLHLSNRSEPEPDIAVVASSPREWKDHPKTALLVVEIADTTLRLDRTRKARVYAEAGIADYWIINLVARQIEIHRNPQMNAITGEYQYNLVQTAGVSASLSPLAAPDAKIAVADLLP